MSIDSQEIKNMKNNSLGKLNILLDIDKNKDCSISSNSINEYTTELFHDNSVITEDDATILISLLKIKHVGILDRKNSFKKKTKKIANFLNEIYEMNSYPNQSDINDIAVLLGFTDRNIRVWFQNARTYNKRLTHSNEIENRNGNGNGNGNGVRTSVIVSIFRKHFLL